MQRVIWLILALALVAAPVFAQSRTGAVTGQLRHRDGTPAVGVRVTAAEVARSGEEKLIVSLTQTDSAGRYRLEDIPPGRYHILAGSLTGATFHPGVSTENDAAIVNVAAGATVSGIDFPVLGRSLGLRVSGRVVVDTNLPAPTQVQLTSPDPRALSPNTSAAVNADGAFEFRGLSPGSYTLRANAPGALTRTVVLEDDPVTGVELAVRSVITMVVRTFVFEDGPMPRYSLSLDSSQGAFTSAVNNQPDGYTHLSLPVGSYRITAASLPTDYRLDTLGYGDEDLRDGMIDIRAAEVRQLTIRLAATAPQPWRKISGRVSGAVKAGVTVTVTPMDGPGLVFPPATVRPDGSFDLPKVLPGTYTARAIPSSIGATATTAVVTVADQDVSDVELRLPTPVEVSGRVIVEGGGGGAPRISLLLTSKIESFGAVPVTPPVNFPGSPPAPPPLQRPLTFPPGQINVAPGPDGTFKVSLPDGENTLSLAPLPTSADGQPLFFVRSLRLGNVDLLKEPLKLAAGDRRELVLTLAASRQMFSVSGRVTGANPQFRNRGTIHLVGNSGFNQQASIAADGSFRFDRIPPGEYSARPVPTALGASAPKVTVGNGNVAGVEVFVPASVPVKGRVTIENAGPMPKVTIEVTLPAGPLRRTLSIARDGAFEETLPEGSYAFRLVAEDNANAPPGYTLKALRYGADDLTTQPLKLTANAPRQLNITLAVAGTMRSVSGRVITSNAQFMASGRVVLERDEEPIVSSPVAADGSFFFDKVIPGAYSARALPLVPGSKTATVTVTDRDVSGIELRVPAMVTVNGVVTVEDNGPIPRQLRLSIANGSERIPVSITVPLSGRFTTSWPEGERRLDFSNVVDPLGLEAVNALPEGYALKSARQGNADILTEPLKLVAGGTVNVEITLHVTLPMFAVSGRLEAPSRSATRMILTPDRASPGALSRNPLEAVIAADGSFEFPRVLPGKYMLRGNTDAPGASVNVNVIDGDVRGVIIRATGG